MEALSGTLTGAVYNDRRLRKVFKGEGHTQNVLAIKTHFSAPERRRNSYDNVILLIRTPRKSIVSHYNFGKTRSHLKTVNSTAYNTSAWNRYVSQTLAQWKTFYYNWLQGYKGRIMVLSYSRLQQDFLNEVFRMSQFLNLTINYNTLWCTYTNQEGMFHRKSPDAVNEDDVFTDSMLQKIESVKSDVEQKIKRMFGIDGFL